MQVFSKPTAAAADRYLDILEEKLRKAYREYMNKGVIPSPSLLKSELLPSSGLEEEPKLKTPDFLLLFEDYIQFQVGKGIKHGTKKSYQTTLSRLRRYVDLGNKLQIDQYTNAVHQDILRTLAEVFDLQPNSLKILNNIIYPKQLMLLVIKASKPLKTVQIAQKHCIIHFAPPPHIYCHWKIESNRNTYQQVVLANILL
jgi:hypothetical protein